ncbi:MAG: bifunctional diaminohydroxyphosphoribosylaminopyrimidine deaminase/5-amino-6-(5-phosphoribosylamino)uracil reductase RibD [Alphaproteobacteria bacterium]
MPNQAEIDHRYMALALRLAARGLGQVAPNPSVGCVLVQDNRIIGRGWTQPGGRPHAEAHAIEATLERLGHGAIEGATAYVTLEPCSHHGKSPPCANALVKAGVTRVVVACLDPDPRVNGKGIAALADSGIEVIQNVLHDPAVALNAGFISRVTLKRPMVIFKAATTLDGKIATHTGDSQWITDTEARKRGHLLRARVDAIMVGGGTVIADDPELTCRIPGLENRSPLRVVLDSRLGTPLTSKLVKTAHAQEVRLYTRKDADKSRVKAFEAAGVTIVKIEADAAGRVQITKVLEDLAKAGITRLLVEGGAHLAASLMAANLVDRLCWFRAPALIGADGLSALAPFGIDNMGQVRRFAQIAQERLGDDVLEIFAPTA